MPAPKIQPRFTPAPWFIAVMSAVIIMKACGLYHNVNWWWILMPIIVTSPFYILSYIVSRIITKKAMEEITERPAAGKIYADGGECPSEYSCTQTQKEISSYQIPALSLEWSEFNWEKGYEKEMQDIKLKNGDIVMMCWPNGGDWFICGEKEANKKYLHREFFSPEEVAMVRLTHSKEW